MKRLVCAAMLIAAVSSASAQSSSDTAGVPFYTGCAEYGAMSYFVPSSIIPGNNFKADGPSFRLTFDHCFKEFPFGLSLGWGAFFGYSELTESYRGLGDNVWNNATSSWEASYVDKTRQWKRLYAGPAVSAHYALFSRLEVYAKGFFCVDFGGVLSEKSLDRPNKLRQNYGILAGSTFFFTKNLGISVEAGLQEQYIGLGLVFKASGRSPVSDLFYRTPKDI